MAAGWLATELDTYMLSGKIFSRGTPDSGMPVRPGTSVSTELHGRMLCRYIIDPHEPPRTSATWVSPTPLSSEELIPYLALPNPLKAREFVLFLDPSKISDIQGPRWTSMGQGIEYLLPGGYPASAVVPPGWGVRIR
jgi:hypothetical protein